MRRRQQPTVLVTGGAGYIGSHVCYALSQHGGFRVVSLDVNPTRHAFADAAYQGDFADVELLARIFDQAEAEAEEGEEEGDDDAELGVARRRGVVAVAHLAAFLDVGESMREASKYFVNNVAKLVTLLDFMTTRQCKRLLFSSSCTVYGTADRLPVSEEEAVKPPESVYGLTKQMGETSFVGASLLSLSFIFSVSLRRVRVPVTLILRSLYGI